MRVLVLNPGSSTLKASLVDAGGDRIAASEAEWPPSPDDALEAPSVVRAALDALPDGADAVGYRVVHGGSAYRVPAPVDDRLLETVERLDELAPLHNRRAALVMRAARDAKADLPHVACFDTAFHASLPEEAWRYALPRDWVDAHGIRRFGFHGLSVAWAVRRAGELLDRPSDELAIIVAHLGSGSSVTAVEEGRSIATSMGFTPYEGLVMGSRSGSVDPGILLHLLRHGVSADALADGLATQSGLRGMAGSADVRELLGRAGRGDTVARLALDVFERSAAAGIAAMASALPRLDALVFTGGIGEHAAPVRSGIARRLAVLGVPRELMEDPDGDAVLAPGPPALLAVRSREDRVIADLVAGLVSG
jgi:acetate kinase